jgi:hypothetical protein
MSFDSQLSSSLWLNTHTPCSPVKAVVLDMDRVKLVDFDK